MVVSESTPKEVSAQEFVLPWRIRAGVVILKSMGLLSPRLEARTPLSFRSSRVVALPALLALLVA